MCIWGFFFYIPQANKPSKREMLKVSLLLNWCFLFLTCVGSFASAWVPEYKLWTQHLGVPNRCRAFLFQAAVIPKSCLWLWIWLNHLLNLVFTSGWICWVFSCLDTATSGCGLAPCWGCQREWCYLMLMCSPYSIFCPSSSWQPNRHVIRFSPCSISPLCAWAVGCLSSQRPWLQCSPCWAQTLSALLINPHHGLVHCPNQHPNSSVNSPPSISEGHTQVWTIKDSVYWVNTSY